MNCLFQEQLDKLEIELSDTGAISTFLPPSLKTPLGSVPAVSQTGRSSRDPEARSDVMERLGESPVRRTIHPRRSLGPVTQVDAAGPSYAGAAAPSAERHIDRGLMWTRPRPSPCHVYKQDLMKLNLETVSFAQDARRILDDVTLSVNELFSTTGSQPSESSGN